MSLHLVPADAEDQHELHVACPCLPSLATGPRPDGTMGHIVDHTGETPEQDQPEE